MTFKENEVLEDNAKNFMFHEVFENLMVKTACP